MAFTIPHNELAGWPRERLSQKGIMAERRVICDWEDRVTLANEFWAYDNAQYPTAYGGNGYMWIVDLRVQPWPNTEMGADAGDSKMATYSGDKSALIIARYSTDAPMRVSVNDQLILQEWFDTGIGTTTIDHRGLKWTTGDKAVVSGDAPKQMVPTIQYVLEYQQLTAVPASVLTHVGKVNSGSTTCYMLDASFPTQTLLYLGALILHRVTTAGSQRFKVQHRFSYKYNDGKGWNYFWNKKENKYEKITQEDGGAFTPYTPISFNF